MCVFFVKVNIPITLQVRAASGKIEIFSCQLRKQIGIHMNVIKYCLSKYTDTPARNSENICSELATLSIKISHILFQIFIQFVKIETHCKYLLLLSY